METILEDQRRLHEERERLIDIQTKEILRKKATVNRHFFFKFSFKNPSKQIFFSEQRTTKFRSFGKNTLGCKLIYLFKSFFSLIS